MKLNPFAICLFCLVPVSAQAADLPMRSAPPVFVPPVAPSFAWTGFYVGGNAGHAFDNKTSYDIVGNGGGNAAAIAAGRRPGHVSTSGNGFTGGGQIGYNFQIDNQLVPGFGFGFGNNHLVAGVEADAAYTDSRASSEFVGPLGFDRSYFNSRTDFLGTARGRIGVAFDNVLVYGTGGFAYGGVNDAATYYFNPNRGPNYANGSNTIRTGYAYGGGVEFGLPTASFINIFHSSAVTLKVEYLHYDLGTSTLVLTNLAGFTNTYVARVHTDGNLVRGGINYKFDFAGAPAPVVASY